MRFSLLKWYVHYQLRSVRQLRHLSFSGSHVREAGVLTTTEIELGEAGNLPKSVYTKSGYGRVVAQSFALVWLCPCAHSADGTQRTVAPGQAPTRRDGGSVAFGESKRALKGAGNEP